MGVHYDSKGVCIMNDMEYAETLADMLRSLDDSTLQKAIDVFQATLDERKEQIA